MKTLRLLGIVAVALLLAAGVAQAKPKGCLTIQSGLLVDSVGNPIETGYDQWGYNYQARSFNGNYCDFSRGVYVPAGCPNDDTLQMKWNDAWLSNKDCDDPPDYTLQVPYAGATALPEKTERSGETIPAIITASQRLLPIGCRSYRRMVSRRDLRFRRRS